MAPFLPHNLRIRYFSTSLPSHLSTRTKNEDGAGQRYYSSLQKVALILTRVEVADRIQWLLLRRSQILNKTKQKERKAEQLAPCLRHQSGLRESGCGKSLLLISHLDLGSRYQAGPGSERFLRPSVCQGTASRPLPGSLPQSLWSPLLSRKPLSGAPRLAFDLLNSFLLSYFLLRKLTHSDDVSAHLCCQLPASPSSTPNPFPSILLPKGHPPWFISHWLLSTVPTCFTHNERKMPDVRPALKDFHKHLLFLPSNHCHVLPPSLFPDPNLTSFFQIFQLFLPFPTFFFF